MFFHNQKNIRKCYFNKRKSAFGKFPHPHKPSLALGVRRPVVHPGLLSRARNTPTSAQELGVESGINPNPRGEAGNEKWVFCCFSCKQALGSHPFPLPLPSPPSHRFSSSGSLSKTSTTELTHSSGKFPTRIESQDLSVLGDGFEGK